MWYVEPIDIAGDNFLSLDKRDVNARKWAAASSLYSVKLSAVIDEIKAKFEADQTERNLLKKEVDPWSALQSTRDKLKNLEVQLTKASEKLEHAKVLLENAASECNSLQEKRTELLSRLEHYRSRVSDNFVHEGDSQHVRQQANLKQVLVDIKAKLSGDISEQGTEEFAEIRELMRECLTAVPASVSEF